MKDEAGAATFQWRTAKSNRLGGSQACTMSKPRRREPTCEAPYAPERLTASPM